MVDYWFASAQGHRITMEDRHLISERGNWVLFAVCDGHGGREVVDQMAAWLPSSVLDLLPKKPLSCQQLKQILERAILELDRRLYEALGHPRWFSKGIRSGSTLILCVYNQFSHQIAIASVGDSRAVLFDSAGTIIVETKDHKPTDIAEKARVEASGSFIERNRVAGTLAMTRAMGDFALKKIKGDQYDGTMGAVSAMPQLFAGYLNLNANVITLILACDGVWDVFSSEDAVSLVLKSKDNLADHLMRSAFNQGSRDNITAMIIRFRAI